MKRDPGDELCSTQCNFVSSVKFLIFAPLDTVNCRGDSPDDSELNIRSPDFFSACLSNSFFAFSYSNVFVV